MVTHTKSSDAGVRERLLLVRRVREDNEQAARVAEEEFHRSSWWAYKWLKRFDKSGLGGLKDLPRSGRPPEVPEEKFAQIRRELSENPSAWKAKEIMNIIYEKAGVRYHEVHVYRL
jgi:transposase